MAKDPQDKPAKAAKGRRQAADMAGKEIDRLEDLTATSEQRETRKRRLIKGPKEFRDLRLASARKTN
jgi:hypothetical protein